MERCPDTTNTNACELHGYLSRVLDNQSFTLRKKYGEIKEEDFDVAESALKNLDSLWTTTNLGKMPKFHSMFEHALKQGRVIGGFGDMFKDDVEVMHQIAGRLESRARKIKGHEKQTLSHAKMEAIIHLKFRKIIRCHSKRHCALSKLTKS
jgi:hypothetical protein